MYKPDLRDTRLAGLLLCLFLASCASIASASESALNQRWRGAWVILGADSFSGCGGSFTNNEVRGLRLRSKGNYRFRAGELGTVHKINLKRKQVEVLVELAQPLRVPRQEGPFTLYDQLPCKVELQIPLPPGTSGQTEAVDRRISELLERHESRQSAESSARWNGRLPEPYPENYDQTLYEYERWRTEQLNAAVAVRIDQAIDEATRLVDRLDDDPEYLAGFAKGVDRARGRDLGDDCERLLSRSIRSLVVKASNDESRSWRAGYQDGQELVFQLETGRRLRRCFVPPPS